MAGDVLVTIEEARFSPGELVVPDGAAGIHVDNRDTDFHTFSIEEVGVELMLPAGKARLVEFDLEPGVYTFFCRPHPAMTGSLVVLPGDLAVVVDS